MAVKRFFGCYSCLFLVVVYSGCQGGSASTPSGNSRSDSQGNHPSGCPAPQKITAIYREWVHDLSGYDNGAGDPFNLFDENAFVDPRAENAPGSGYLPVTDPQPKIRPSIYFQLGRGNRIVVDLQVAYKLAEVYLYDRSRVNDSVWIYTGNMRHWNQKAALVTGTTTSVGAWRKFPLDDSSRFVMIRFSSYETAISEMVLYGCPYGPVPPPPDETSHGPLFSKKRMKDFLGVNYVMEDELQWLRPFHYSRLYNMALDYDNDTVHTYPDIRYNMLHYGYWDDGRRDYHFNIDDIRNLNGGEVWYSIRGVSRWMAKKGYTERERPVTVPGMDPEDPMSYARHAAMMWNMAAFFGNTKTDTSRMALSHEPRISGRGSMNVFENGNEEDAVWEGQKYCTPLAYFAQSSADYDGHEGRMGPGYGIHGADSTSRLMASGLTELDTNRVRTYKFLCDNLRNDKKFVWTGGIQYHHYSTTGKKGLTPEEDSLRWRLSRVRQCSFRIQPDVQCVLGENGYDKNPRSPQGAPPLPGMTPGQSQGVFILRSINATAFSGFDAYILFWLRDSEPESNSNVFATCGILGPHGPGGTIAFPAWYYISCYVRQLGNYVPDSILSEQGKVWIYRYRNQQSPDSLAYFVYSPTRNGSLVKDYPLPVGSPVKQSARVVEFAEGRVDGAVTDLKTEKGILHLTVTEKPKMVLVRN